MRILIFLVLMQSEYRSTHRMTVLLFKLISLILVNLIWKGIKIPRFQTSYDSSYTINHLEVFFPCIHHLYNYKTAVMTHIKYKQNV